MLFHSHTYMCTTTHMTVCLSISVWTWTDLSSILCKWPKPIVTPTLTSKLYSKPSDSNLCRKLCPQVTSCPLPKNGDRNGWIDGWREPLQLLLLMLLCVLSLLSSFFAFHSGWRSGLISITTAKEEFFKTRRPLDLSSRICLRSQTGQQKKQTNKTKHHR